MRESVSGWMGLGAGLGEKGGGASVDTPRGPLPFLAVPAGGRCLAGETGLESGLVCPRAMLDQTELWPRLPVLCQGARTPRSWVLSAGVGAFHRAQTMRAGILGFPLKGPRMEAQTDSGFFFG